MVPRCTVEWNQILPRPFMRSLNPFIFGLNFKPMIEQRDFPDEMLSSHPFILRGTPLAEFSWSMKLEIPFFWPSEIPFFNTWSLGVFLPRQL